MRCRGSFGIGVACLAIGLAAGVLLPGRGSHDPANSLRAAAAAGDSA
jgi:hypothetical protein